jgi:hypothetical protein
MAGSYKVKKYYPKIIPRAGTESTGYQDIGLPAN